MPETDSIQKSRSGVDKDTIICPTCELVCLKKQNQCLQCGTVFTTDKVTYKENNTLCNNGHHQLDKYSHIDLGVISFAMSISMALLAILWRINNGSIGLEDRLHFVLVDILCIAIGIIVLVVEYVRTNKTYIWAISALLSHSF